MCILKFHRTFQEESPIRYYLTVSTEHFSDVMRVSYFIVYITTMFCGLFVIAYRLIVTVRVLNATGAKESLLVSAKKVHFVTNFALTLPHRVLRFILYNASVILSPEQSLRFENYCIVVFRTHMLILANK